LRCVCLEAHADQLCPTRGIDRAAAARRAVGDEGGVVDESLGIGGDEYRAAVAVRRVAVEQAAGCEGGRLTDDAKRAAIARRAVGSDRDLLQPDRALGGEDTRPPLAPAVLAVTKPPVIDRSPCDATAPPDPPAVFPTLVTFAGISAPPTSSRAPSSLPA
jgi:hypothetical protein